MSKKEKPKVTAQNEQRAEVILIGLIRVDNSRDLVREIDELETTARIDNVADAHSSIVRVVNRYRLATVEPCVVKAFLPKETSEEALRKFCHAVFHDVPWLNHIEAHTLYNSIVHARPDNVYSVLSCTCQPQDSVGPRLATNMVTAKTILSRLINQFAQRSVEALCRLQCTLVQETTALSRKIERLNECLALADGADDAAVIRKISIA